MSASQKSSRFINSYLRYSWFQNSAIWFSEGLFARTKIKNFKPTFIVLQSISTWRKWHWLTLLLLRYNWFKNLKIWLVNSKFDNVQLKIYKTSFRILQSIYNCLSKIMLILKLLPEIQLTQEFCNLVGQKHFCTGINNTLPTPIHNASQVSLEFISQLKLLPLTRSKIKFITVDSILLSTAQTAILHITSSGTSLMYTTKRVGQRRENWGAPGLTRPFCENFWSIFKNPQHLSLWKRPASQTLSRAFVIPHASSIGTNVPVSSKMLNMFFLSNVFFLTQP